MNVPVLPELSTASVGTSQAPTAAVDNSAPSATRPQSTYKSGKAVQTNGATSGIGKLVESSVIERRIEALENGTRPFVQHFGPIRRGGDSE